MRVRFGCRRLTIVLRREGWHVSAKRVYRFYTLEGLAVPTKVGNRIARRRPVVAGVATGPNQRWSMIFVAARLGDGRRFRIPDRPGPVEAQARGNVGEGAPEG